MAEGKERFAIVRVDNNCPMYTEKFNSVTCENMFRCSRLWQIKKCGNFCKYGDTKEQLIHKIVQVMLRKFLKGYLGTAMKPKMAEEQIEIVYKNYLEIAKEIVEFLGVEE